MRHGAAPRRLHHCSAQQLCFCPNATACASVEGPGRDFVAPDSEQAGREVRAHVADAGACQRLLQAGVSSRRCDRGDTRPASATMAATTRRLCTMRSWGMLLPRSTTERSQPVRCAGPLLRRSFGWQCLVASPRCEPSLLAHRTVPSSSARRSAAAHAQHAAQPAASHAPAAGGTEVPDHQGFSAHSECVTSLPPCLPRPKLTCAGAQRSKHKHRKARSPVCGARGGVFGRHQRCAGARVIVMRGGRPLLTCHCAARCCW